MNLDKLNWLTGHWQGSIEGEFVEEVWSSVHAKSMMGMFRWIKDEIPLVMEFVFIKQVGEEITLNLRHFDQNFHAEEDKEEYYSFKLEKLEPNHARFVHEGPQNYMQLSYTRENTNSLIAELKMGKDEPRILTFNFQLFKH